MTVRADGVALITYDVPGEPVNTLRAGSEHQLLALLAQLERDPDVVAAVLCSGKADSFVVGADIQMLRSARTAREVEELSRSAQQAFERLARLSKPVVAAIHGPCLGGGFELALACHARVCSDDPRTALGLPEVQLGLLPAADGLQRLAMLVGLRGALEHGTTGKSMRAEKARKLGVVAEVVKREILLETAASLALELARPDAAPSPRKKPDMTELLLEKNPLGRALIFHEAREQAQARTGGHYPAVTRIIDVLEVFAKKGLEASRPLEAAAFGELAMSEVAARLMEIFFAQAASKKDRGVDDPKAKARSVHKIGMIGAGFMGAGIAYVSADAGVEVRLKDTDDQGLTRGLASVSQLIEARRRRGSLTATSAEKKLALITGTTDYRGLGNADVVIEAVFEDLALKHRILAEVEAIGGASTIFASNTSSIPIGKIAAAAKRPKLVVGMHYFSPVHKMPLLEVVQTRKTAPWVVATAVALGKQQGKTVIVVNDGAGFYTSRVLAPLMNEASWLLSEGVPIHEIDGAMVRWGWPVGPMALLDEVGIDVAAHVGSILHAAFGDRMASPPGLEKLLASGRKGRKSGRGMYLYGEHARASFGKKKPSKSVDPSLHELLGVTPRPGQLPAEEIQMRCTLAFVNEAMHCLGDGVLRSARDGDLGAVFGLGFPPFRGGPFRYVDAISAREVVSRLRGLEDRFGRRFTPAPMLVEAAAANRKLHTDLRRSQAAVAQRAQGDEMPPRSCRGVSERPWMSKFHTPSR